MSTGLSRLVQDQQHQRQRQRQALLPTSQGMILSPDLKVEPTNSHTMTVRRQMITDTHGSPRPIALTQVHGSPRPPQRHTFTQTRVIAVVGYPRLTCTPKQEKGKLTLTLTQLIQRRILLHLEDPPRVQRLRERIRPLSRRKTMNI